MMWQLWQSRLHRCALAVHTVLLNTLMALTAVEFLALLNSCPLLTTLPAADHKKDNKGM